MSELVPNVVRAYWRVLGSMLLCVLAIVMRTDDRSAADPDEDGDVWPGLFWLLYAFAAGVGIAVFGSYGPTPWQFYGAIGAAVLGVLPLYGAFPWSRPGEDRLIYKRAHPPEAPSPGLAWRWGKKKPATANASQSTKGDVPK